MSKVNATAGERRLNLRGLILLGILGTAALAGAGVLKAYQDRRGTPVLLAEVKERLGRKQYALALGYLNRYLELSPNDLDALDLKARILAETAREPQQAVEAMPIHNQVLGRDAGRQETRRRLLELNLKAGRWEAAASLARELIRRGADDAQAHRALARALEGIGERGDTEALREACQEYETAERKEPGDVSGGERLARLYRDRLGNPDRAVAILETLVTLNRKSPEKRSAAHLARARHFLGAGQADRVPAEIDRAVEAAPHSLDARLAAAELANRRGDTEAARRHLAAIPAKARDDLRVKAVEGLIAWREQRPGEAVRSWREGLLQSGGNDAELTNWTALVLLDMGRVREAEPLIAQYRRLIGGNEPNAAYHYLHASYLLRTGQPRAAIQELEATRFQVDRLLEPELYNLLGQCHEAAQDAPNALEAYRRAASLSRSDSAPWLAIARLQWPEQPDAALETLGLGLKALPGEPKLSIQLARLLWERQSTRPGDQRSWGALEEALDRAARVAPDSPDLALVRADYLLSLGKPDAALETLRAVSARHPKNASLRLALANTLSRVGRPADALKVLDQADPSAGALDALIVARASLLLAIGRVKEARGTLTAGLDRVADDRRYALWKALGELDAAQGDPAGARRAYAEYARLQPENPEPRLRLVDLALSAGDEPAIRAAVEALKGLGGPAHAPWRLARIQELLRDRAGPARDDAARLDEAARLVAEANASDPRSPAVPLLEARLCEKTQAVDRAIAAYQRALDRNAGQAALAPLVALLVRERRDADLQRLRAKLEGTAMAGDVDRLEAQAALRLGDSARAERLASRDEPQAPDARLWQAEILSALGKPKAAETRLAPLTATRSDDPVAWLRLLNAQVAQKRQADARATVEQIREKVKTDRPELLWAQCYQAAGDRDRARECYRAALARWPDDPAVLTSAVGFLEQAGQVPEAERWLRQALERDPALTWANRRLALLLADRRGDRGAWEEALRRVGPDDKADDHSDDRLARALVYAQGPEPGHRDRAIAILEKLAAENPGSATVHERLARLWLARGQAGKARIQAALAARGENAGADAILLHAGLLLADKPPSLDEAERQAARLAAIGADSLPVAELRARIASARGRGAEAAATLELAFDARANTPEALDAGEKMIALLLDLKQKDAAERVGRKLAGLGAPGRCLLARVLAPLGKTGEALALVEAAGLGKEKEKERDPHQAVRTALELASRPNADPRWIDLADRLLDTARKTEPDSTDLLWKQAILRRLQHRHQEEAALYQAVLAKEPGSVRLRNDLAWTLSEDLNKPREALEQADEALRRAGGQPHVLDTRGVILTRLDRLNDAVEDLEAAARALPVGPVYYHLARAYRKMGRADDFQKCRDRARQLGLTPEQLQPSERRDWAVTMKD